MSYSYPKALYVVRLNVENVSIISSYLTWGFPAPSAFTGLMHNLQRQLNKMDAYREVECCGIGIISHQFTPQVTKSSSYRYSPYRLNLARHPLKADGSTPAMIEEGKGHIEVSLVIGFTGEGLEQHLSANDEDLSETSQALLKKINQFIYSMRLAGGSIFPHKRIQPKLINWSRSEAEEKTKALRRYVLPGFALQHRQEVLLAHQAWLQQYPNYLATQKAEPNLLDTLLDIQRLNFVSTENDESLEAEDAKEKLGSWKVRSRPEHLKGWLVPIPIGYAALTDMQEQGVIKGLRNDQYPATFVETLLSFAEWKSPHRIENITDILWNYNSEPEKGVYELVQPFAPKQNLTSLSDNDSENQSIEFESEEEEY
ncbi:type I-F CRISPR-associated protein Csy2 [Acinetobacter wuhouensis]|uniref:Type I-F CRISPR-associated protein Csy2 n=1 Tax=Acinetobacter wuhouensis TaxID=1879050 RepID=A0A4Q7ALB2_9GAMM|nr:type I-F CRISPR-associated protein Csy2 [Acinetobacter wuhouensis]RZG49353.1 type I-F CRISPR-associated protein Csy2 [Acinetobacter wuhouensis]RZG75261.1 type I-F CRISPR-associated protein Csy2 [Acinetobacter wuhouensis]